MLVAQRIQRGMHDGCLLGTLDAIARSVPRIQRLAAALLAALAIDTGVDTFLVVARVIAKARGVIADAGCTGGHFRPVALVERAGFTGPFARVDLREAHRRGQQEQWRDDFVACVTCSFDHRFMLLSHQLRAGRMIRAMDLIVTVHARLSEQELRWSIAR